MTSQAVSDDADERAARLVKLHYSADSQCAVMVGEGRDEHILFWDTQMDAESHVDELRRHIATAIRSAEAAADAAGYTRGVEAARVAARDACDECRDAIDDAIRALKTGGAP